MIAALAWFLVGACYVVAGIQVTGQIDEGKLAAWVEQQDEATFVGVLLFWPLVIAAYLFNKRIGHD